MDRLEQIMKENKEFFLDQEPLEGHFDRFEQKLMKQSRKIRIIHLTKTISRIAAIGLLTIMSSLWAYNQFINPAEETLQLGEVSQEYREVEFFFTSQINSRYEQINNSEVLENSEYKSTLNSELASMDSVYSELEKKLGANPGDQRIIQAMINHYQMKLKVMSEILEQLKSFEEDDQSHINNQNQYESVKL